MPINLRIMVFIVALILALTIYKVLKHGLVPVKYSLLWILSIIVMLLIAVFPNFLIFISKAMGFVTLANMIAGVFIVVLFFITISLTIIVSTQKKRITLLVQEVSLLKENIKKE